MDATTRQMISEFMGVDITHLDEGNGGMILTSNITDEVGKWTLPHYDTDWRWLMWVVEKIRRVQSRDRDIFGTEVILNGSKTTIKSGSYGVKPHSKLYFNKTFANVSKGSLGVTYEAVVAYIKWYNELHLVVRN
jgi:hypothetical protein